MYKYIFLWMYLGKTLIATNISSPQIVMYSLRTKKFALKVQFLHKYLKPFSLIICSVQTFETLKKK